MKRQEKEHIVFLLNRIIGRHSLSTRETRELVRYVYTKDTSGFLFTAFTTAIHTKGETTEELVGIIRATRDLMPTIKLPCEVTDTSGTGGGSFKTLNVSTMAAFVVAAAGHRVLKASYRGITSPMGSADIFASCGIDVFSLSVCTIASLLSQVGISPYYPMSISPQLANRVTLARKLFIEEGIKIKTPYHLSTNLCSPCKIRKRVYGCYARDELEKLARVFQLLGYAHTLTFWAEIGIPEISNVGRTHFVEQKGNIVTRYVLTPQQLGVSEWRREEIGFISVKQSTNDFTNVLRGKSTEAKIDLVALNAGASLYLLENLNSIREGVRKAKEILYSGKAHTVFTNLVAAVKGS